MRFFARLLGVLALLIGVAGMPLMAAQSSAVTLTVTATDADVGDTLNYNWAIASGPSGGSATFGSTNNTSAGNSCSVTVDTVGVYTFTVMVSDGHGGTASSTTGPVTCSKALYTVTFNSQGGSAPSPSTISVTSGSAYGTLATTSLTGNTFAGWYTAASGGSLVTAGTTVTTTANHTLYAHWTPQTYAVTYNVNGATSGTAPGAQTKTFGVDLTLATNSGSLAKTGATFTGWNTAADGSGTAYAVGANYTGNAALVLYAAWTPLTYAVTYNVNGATSGTAPGGQTKTFGVDLTLATNSGSLAKTGATFTGWNTAADGSGTAYSVGATFTGNAALALYAAWTTLPTYAVTYNANGATGGTVPVIQTKTQGINLTLAGNSGSLVKTGATFAGWNTAGDGSGTAYAAGGVYSTDAAVTLYAQWSGSGTGGGSLTVGSGGGGGGCGAGGLAGLMIASSLFFVRLRKSQRPG